MKKKWFQDGPDFYDEETGELVARYPELVLGDYDIEGAQEARERFLRENEEFERC